MSSNTIVAIAGFTGKMARLITTSLLHNHPDVKIHGICRSPDKVDASIRSNPKITLFQASSTDVPALRRALAGTSVCICAYLGDKTLMTDGQKILIDACIAENVPRYIASDWSLDFRGLKLGDHPAKDPMKVVQAYLDEKESEGKIKGVHILNGAFMQVIWSFMGYADTEKGIFRFFGTGEEKLEMTTYEDAAAFTAEVAVDLRASGFLKVLGDRKSVKELAKQYNERYGVQPEMQQLGSLDDLYSKMQAAFKGQPENPYTWMGMFYQYYMQNGSTWVGTLDNERYPSVKPVTVEEFLKGHTKESLGRSTLF